MSERVEIFADGACSGNPGPGGWAAIVCLDGRKIELSGKSEQATTNNRMELTAVIEAFKQLPGQRVVTVTTDSEYVQKGITSWIQGWKRKGWKSSTGSAVKNQDLWQALDELNARHQVEWKWVKGHAGHPENERCDELARAATEGSVLAGQSMARPESHKPEKFELTQEPRVSLVWSVDDVLDVVREVAAHGSDEKVQWTREQGVAFLIQIEERLVTALSREGDRIIRQLAEAQVRRENASPGNGVEEQEETGWLLRR